MNTPKLSRKIMVNYGAMADAINGVLVSSKKHKALSKKIRRWGRRLHKAVDAEAWMLYLRLEELMNDRAVLEQDLLVAWAFEQGRKRR